MPPSALVFEEEFIANWDPLDAKLDRELKPDKVRAQPALTAGLVAAAIGECQWQAVNGRVPPGGKAVAPSSVSAAVPIGSANVPAAAAHSATSALTLSNPIIRSASPLAPNTPKAPWGDTSAVPPSARRYLLDDLLTKLGPPDGDVAQLFAAAWLTNQDAVDALAVWLNAAHTVVTNRENENLEEQDGWKTDLSGSIVPLLKFLLLLPIDYAHLQSLSSPKTKTPKLVKLLAESSEVSPEVRAAATAVFRKWRTVKPPPAVVAAKLAEAEMKSEAAAGKRKAESPLPEVGPKKSRSSVEVVVPRKSRTPTPDPLAVASTSVAAVPTTASSSKPSTHLAVPKPAVNGAASTSKLPARTPTAAGPSKSPLLAGARPPGQGVKPPTGTGPAGKRTVVVKPAAAAPKKAPSLGSLLGSLGSSAGAAAAPKIPHQVAKNKLLVEEAKKIKKTVTWKPDGEAPDKLEHTKYFTAPIYGDIYGNELPQQEIDQNLVDHDTRRLTESEGETLKQHLADDLDDDSGSSDEYEPELEEDEDAVMHDDMGLDPVEEQVPWYTPQELELGNDYVTPSSYESTEGPYWSAQPSVGGPQEEKDSPSEPTEVDPVQESARVLGLGLVTEPKKMRLHADLRNDPEVQAIIQRAHGLLPPAPAPNPAAHITLQPSTAMYLQQSSMVDGLSRFVPDVNPELSKLLASLQPSIGQQQPVSQPWHPPGPVSGSNNSLLYGVSPDAFSRLQQSLRPNHQPQQSHSFAGGPMTMSGISFNQFNPMQQQQQAVPGYPQQRPQQQQQQPPSKRQRKNKNKNSNNANNSPRLPCPYFVPGGRGCDRGDLCRSLHDRGDGRDVREH